MLFNPEFSSVDPACTCWVLWVVLREVGGQLGRASWRKRWPHPISCGHWLTPRGVLKWDLLPKDALKMSRARRRHLQNLSNRNDSELGRMFPPGNLAKNNMVISNLIQNKMAAMNINNLCQDEYLVWIDDFSKQNEYFSNVVFFSVVIVWVHHPPIV